MKSSWALCAWWAAMAWAQADWKAEVREKLARSPLDSGIEEALKRGIAANERDAEAHYLYAQWAILNHREALCVQEENRVVALSAGNRLAVMQAYTLIGLAEDRLGHEARARVAFEKARSLNRSLERPDARALEEYAAFLARHERQEAALAVVKEVLAIDEHLSSAHLTRARLLGNAGSRAEALAEGEKALAGAMDADDERAAHSFLAKTYFAAGEPEKAQTHVQWVELHP